MSKLLVSYLSLNEPPAERLAAAGSRGLYVARCTIGVDDYLALYRKVGGPWGWDQRLRMPRHLLAAFLAGPDCEIFCLQAAGFEDHIIGFCEFDCSSQPKIQLTNFGLIPGAIGRGAGPYLLNVALRTVWHQRQLQRIWLHTDTNDHPKARETYLRAGFAVDCERWQDATEL